MGGQVPRKKNITYKLEDMWICMCGLKAKDNVHKLEKKEPFKRCYNEIEETFRTKKTDNIL